MGISLSNDFKGNRHIIVDSVCLGQWWGSKLWWQGVLEATHFMASRKQREAGSILGQAWQGHFQSHTLLTCISGQTPPPNSCCSQWCHCLINQSVSSSVRQVRVLLICHLSTSGSTTWGTSLQHVCFLWEHSYPNGTRHVIYGNTHAQTVLGMLSTRTHMSKRY